MTGKSDFWMGVISPDGEKIPPTECEDCRRQRSNLTWHGEPPKCAKHSENNITYIP